MPSGGRGFQRIGGHETLEDGLAGTGVEQPAAQADAKIFMAVQWAKVEEDGGEKQRLWLRLANPAGEFLAPFLL